MSSPARNTTISSSHRKHSLNNTTTSLPSSTNNKKQKQGDIASRALAALHSDTDDDSMNKSDDNLGEVQVVQSDKENSIMSETQDVVDKETSNTTNDDNTMDNTTKTTLDFTEKPTNVVDMTNSGSCKPKSSFDDMNNFNNQPEDTDIIIPHSPTSQYNNILSSYLSTPFDKHAMISLHCTKEIITNNNSLYSSHNSPYAYSKVERKRKANSDRLVEFNNWIDKQKQNVPTIISQKQYIKRRKRAEIAAAQAIETQGSDEGSTLSSEAINKAILSFLIKEAENSLQGRMLQERLIAEQQQQKKIQEELKRRNELATVAGIDQNGGLTPRTKKRVVDELLSRQQQVVVGTIPPPVHKPSSNQEQQQISTHQRYASMNNSMLETQIQRQQMEQQQLLSQMATMGNTAPQFGGYPQQQMYNNGYQQGNNMNDHHGSGFVGGNWQYPAPFTTAPVYPNNLQQQNAYIQRMAHQSFTAPPSQVNTTTTTTNGPTKKIPVATSEVVELTNSNRNEIAKLPVAFGFSLNDDASEIVAKRNTEKWLEEGKKHINDGKNKKKGTNNKENKKGSRKSNTPSKGGTKGGTPGKSPAELLSTKPASNLPNGWLVKVFKRMSGATAGSTDKYFYSPNNEIKFRSIKACRQFIDILDEPGINGDEAAALKLFKSRGNRN